VEFVCAGLKTLSILLKEKELDPTEEDIQEVEEWAKEWPRVKFDDLVSDWKKLQDGEEDGGGMEDEDEEDENPLLPRKRAWRWL
jgi:hypothetical protein